MLKLAALAIAVTVAGPGYSASIDEDDVRTSARVADGTARQKERQALDYLISRAWIEGEGRERGIAVTRAEARERFEEEVRLSFARRADFERFLRESGHTRATLIDRIRTELISDAIREQIAVPAAKSVTPEQVDAYVDAHPQIVPAQRTARVIRVRTRAEARATERRIARGATLRALGATTREFQAGEGRLARAVFRAPRDRVTRYGTHVFKVVKIRPARPLPRAQQETQAWERLSSEAQQRAIEVFAGEFKRKWRARTTCAPRYADHPDCGPPPPGQVAP